MRRTGVSKTQINPEIIEHDLHSVDESFENVEIYNC